MLLNAVYGDSSCGSIGISVEVGQSYPVCYKTLQYFYFSDWDFIGVNIYTYKTSNGVLLYTKTRHITKDWH